MSILEKIREKRFLMCCILLVYLFIPVTSPAVHAASMDAVTLAIEQVFVKPAGSKAADTFTYTLTAQQSGNPMPTGSSGDTCTFTMSDTDTVNLEPITYSTAGTYIYEIRQTVAAAQTGYTYDRQVYKVKVYATNTAGGLQADVVVYNEKGLKVSTITFENGYAPLASDTINRTRSTGGTKTGDDAMIGLYQAMLSIGGIVLMAWVVYLITDRKNET